MRWTALILVLGVASVAAADEPTPGPDTVFTPPRAERMRLDNGLAVLVVRRPALPLVALLLVAPDAGSAADPPGKAGLAAYTADLLDEGAGGKGALDLARAADELGAQISIATGADASTVLVQTLSATLPASVALLESIVARPTFAASEAARVHAHRLVAAELRRDRPSELAEDLLAGALYGDRAPHGHPAAGDAATIKGLTLADARGFYARAWHPAGMTLIVAGDVDPATLRATLAPLAAWKGGGHAGRPPAPRPGDGARLRLVHRPAADQSDVELGVLSIGRNDPRFAAWDVALNAFAGGFTGRLTQRLREQLGYLYHVYPSIHLHAGGGDYSVLASLFTPRTADGMREIIALADDLAAHPMADAELRKAKQNLIRALPERFEDNTSTAWAFADLVIAGLDDGWYAGYARAIDAVSAAAAQAAARELLAGRLRFAVVGDLSRVGEELARLGLGNPERFDLDGRKVTGTAGRPPRRPRRRLRSRRGR